MDRGERRERKARPVAAMLQGGKWRVAAERAAIRTSRTAAYRLLRPVRPEGDATLEERRHGHPHKVTPLVREWLVERCRGIPDLPGRVLRTEIEERFGVITHINRVRAELGISNTSQIRGGNQRPPDVPAWRGGETVPALQSAVAA